MPAIKDINLAEFDSYSYSGTGSAPRPIKKTKVSKSKSQSYVLAQAKFNELDDSMRKLDSIESEREYIESMRIERSFSYVPDEGFADPRS